MYFDIKDNILTQKNDPVKLPAAMHYPVAFVNVILIAWLIVSAAGFQSFLSVGVIIGILVPIYLIYLCVVYCKSENKDYIHNMKPFDDYQATYDKMVKGRGFFTFKIECYH